MEEKALRGVESEMSVFDHKFCDDCGEEIKENEEHEDCLWCGATLCVFCSEYHDENYCPMQGDEAEEWEEDC